MNQEQIPLIVLTGGPCGGKSTILHYLSQKLSDIGYFPIIIPETATELILSGVSPETVGQPAFQRLAARKQASKEKIFLDAARMMKHKRIVLLCDRANPDLKSYTTPEDFALMLEEFNTDFVQFRDLPYVGVVFLRSVAVDKPLIYTTANNQARKETVAEAKALDELTLKAWTGHPHLRIIDNANDIDFKARQTFMAVCQMLGVPEPIEIERKFLVKNFDPACLPELHARVHIVQHYLENPGMAERIRKRSHSGGAAYYHTLKKLKEIGVNTEIERQISAEEYDRLLGRVNPRSGMVKKDRYCFVYENQYFELDVFVGLPLVMLELELIEKGQEIKLPPFLEIEREVTDDPKYSNKEIARSLAL